MKNLAGAVDGIRYEIGELPLRDGSVERVAFSLETCRCGYSLARAGVGYLNSIVNAWVCKQCGDAHTPYQVGEGVDEAYEAEQKVILKALGVDHYSIPKG